LRRFSRLAPSGRNLTVTQSSSSRKESRIAQQGMESFRHNLTPVEVKKFLKDTENLTEDLLIRYCFKVEYCCPHCGCLELCSAGAISLFSSRMDKITHEIHACLHCGYQDLSTVLTLESL
jgi:hypothetical protein